MRRAGLVILLFFNLAAAETKSGLGARILETLVGPPLKGPRPPTRAALLQCQRPAAENADMQLLKSAGIPEVLVLSVHRDQKTWPKMIQRLYKLYPDHLVTIVLDLSCPAAMDTLLMANETKMFGLPYRWLLVYPPSTESSMTVERCSELAEAVLGRLSILLDSEVLSMCRYGENAASGLLIEWYRLYLRERSLVGELGFWNGDSKIRWAERASKPMALRRMDLQGSKLYVGFVLRYNESLKHLLDGWDTRKDTLTKFYWPIMQNTVQLMNATLVPKFANSWGFPINKSLSNWSGMVGMQMRGEADMSALPALMEHVRNTVLTFVNFDAPSRGIFIFRAPPMTYEANLFALPFPDTLWAAAGGLIATCILFLYLVLTAEDIMDKGGPTSPPLSPAVAPIPVPLREKSAKSKQFLASEPTDDEVDENMVVPVVTRAVGGDGIQAKARLHGSWSDVMLLVFGAICQQGSPVEARTIPGRIVTISMLIGLIFLFTSYSASIVVLLQSTSNSIQTVEDLWKSRLPCGAEDVGYQRYALASMGGVARLGVYKKILKKNKKNPSGNNFMDLESGMERVRRDYFAFHALTTSMFPIISDTWQEHEKCALKTHIKNMVYPQNPDINTNKHSPLLEAFRLTLRKQFERGIRKREIARIVTGKPVCTNPGSNFSSVSVMDSYFALVILTTGIFGSLFVLIIEHLAFRRLKTAAKEAAAAAEAAAYAAARIRGHLLSSKRI